MSSPPAEVPATHEPGWAGILLRREVRWFAAAILALTLVADLRSTLDYAGLDLRNRVVGARLLLAGEDPYFHVWSPGQPEALYDPWAGPHQPMNRCTAPPTVLALYAPLAGVGYAAQRVIYLGLSWLCAGGLTILLVRGLDLPAERRLLLVLLLVVFWSGEGWRMHVERGQVYVLFALLLALAHRLGASTLRNAELSCGLLLGLTCALRPTLLVMVAPFALSRRWGVVFGSAIGVAAALLASLPLTGVEAWRSYFRAMRLHGEDHALLLVPPRLRALALEHEEALLSIPGVVGWGAGPSRLHLYLGPGASDSLVRSSVPVAVSSELSARGWGLQLEPARPRRFEGVEAHGRNFPGWSSGFVKLVRHLPVPWRLELLTSSFLVALLAATAIWWRATRGVRPSLEVCFLAGTVAALAAEFFLPAPRYLYNNVLCAVPLGLSMRIQGARTFQGGLGVLFLVSALVGLGTLELCADDYSLGSWGLLVSLLGLTHRAATGPSQ